MNIAILGAGNIACHLSKAFINAGFPVKQIWNRNTDKAIELALEIGANSISDISQLQNDIDLIVIAVSDDAIETVAKQLKLSNNQILVHTSGSTSIDILQHYAENIGVFYPLQTFSKNVNVNFKDIPLCIEGNSEKLANKLLEIANKLTKKAKKVNSIERIKLHIAAVFACNFTNYFYTIADKLLETSGLDFDMIKPLIAETANKIIDNKPENVQTGPAKRNDELTMEKHLVILEEYPEWKDLYKNISQDIVKMYK